MPKSCFIRSKSLSLEHSFEVYKQIVVVGGPNLENRVDVKAIWSAIHVVLQLICDTVICLGERAHFSSSFVVVFWWFLPSNTPIMLYIIHYWWFFLSKGNQWTKYLVDPKIWRTKPFLLMFVSFVALDGFHLLLSTQLTANLSHIHAKTSFCCIETVANNALNCRHVVFDRLWANVTPTFNSFLIDKCSCKMVNTLLSDIFNSSAISCNINLQSAKTSLWSGVFQDNCWTWVTWAFSIICICTTIFKVSMWPLHHCFQRSRVRITLIKPLLCLNNIFFPSESNALSIHEIQIFPLFWKFATVSKVGDHSQGWPEGSSFNSYYTEV